ncbi:MAG: hypothetical protein ACLP1Q_02020 [Solirubrobacteraceae bacterium]
MQRITIFGMTLLSALAIAGVSAVSVSASGHEFVASKLVKTKSKSTNAQIFKTSAGTIECSEVTGTGEITSLKSEKHKEVLTFSGCIGFGGGIKISNADFEYNANGPVKLENRVTITPEGLSCHVTMEPQTVESLHYEDDSGKLKSEATIYKIRSRGSGGDCGGEEEGDFAGTIVGELEGGTLEWK